MSSLWEILSGRAMRQSSAQASKIVKEGQVEACAAHRGLDDAMREMDRTDKALQEMADSMRQAHDHPRD